MTTSKSPALTAAQEALLHEHLPIVNYMVNDLIRRVPNYIQRDDLTSAAMLGLVQAVRSFDTTREAKFATFARVRIQGALLDELRSRDWATRGVRKQARHIESVSEELSSTLGRQPTSAELGQTMGANADQLHRLKADLHRATVLSLDGATAETNRTPLDILAVHQDDIDPAEQLVQRELQSYVRDAVANLPERLRHVVVGYFLEERPMVELAKELGVTESRISHMRSEALALMAEAIQSATTESEPSVEETGVAQRRRTAYYAAVAATSDYRTRLVKTPQWQVQYNAGATV